MSHATYLLSEQIAGLLQWLFCNEVTGIGRYAISPISSSSATPLSRRKPAQTLSPLPGALLPSSLKIPKKQSRAVTYKLLTSLAWPWLAAKVIFSASPQEKVTGLPNGKLSQVPTHTYILSLTSLPLAILVKANHFWKGRKKKSTAAPSSFRLKHLSLILLGMPSGKGIY